VGVVVALLAIAGCSRAQTPDAPAAFCEAAHRYERAIERGASVARQIVLVEQLYDAAPPTIRPEAKTFLDAMRRVESDPSVRDDPKIKTAVEDVNRFAAQGCEFYKSNQTPGGGI
jgi:hypothetical protein